MNAPMLDDTSPEAHRVLAQVYRQMRMEQKATIVDDLNQLTRQLFAVGIRGRIPAASDEQIVEAYMRQALPVELFQEAKRHRDESRQRLERIAAGDSRIS